MNRKVKITALVSLPILVVCLFTLLLNIPNNQNEKNQPNLVINELIEEQQKTKQKAKDVKEEKEAKTEKQQEKETTEQPKKEATEKIEYQSTENQTEAVQVAAAQTTSTAVETARRTSYQPANRGLSRDDIYWLARIIEAEAGGEPFIGKVAVGNVILNRVNHSQFPNTVYGVIFDKQYGYTQFSPVIDGTIYNTPSAESMRAAEAAANGQRPVGSALYFLNPSKSQNFWIPNNRQYMTTIGGHNFYY